jgi:4-hydroxy-tetrahydrodipicolinate synthase
MGLVLNGLLVATVTPFTERLDLDEQALINLIRCLNEVEGLGGIVCNANAGEGAALTRNEKTKVVRLIRKEVRADTPLIAGIVALSTREAIQLALDAKENGCDAILPLSPIIHGWNASKNPEFAIEYHKAIDRECNMPMILFQYKEAVPGAYSHNTLLKLCCEIENVIAVKHAQLGAGLFRFAEDVYALQQIGRRVSNLVAHGALLFHAGMMGCVDGALTGFGNVMPKETAALLKAIAGREFEIAEKMNKRIYAVARLVYAEPYVYLHSRYKEAAAMVGLIPSGRVRGPQLLISEAERAALEDALKRAGMLQAYKF